MSSLSGLTKMIYKDLWSLFVGIPEGRFYIDPGTVSMSIIELLDYISYVDRNGLVSSFVQRSGIFTSSTSVSEFDIAFVSEYNPKVNVDLDRFSVNRNSIEIKEYQSIIYRYLVHPTTLGGETVKPLLLLFASLMLPTGATQKGVSLSRSWKETGQGTRYFYYQVNKVEICRRDLESFGFSEGTRGEYDSLYEKYF